MPTSLLIEFGCSIGGPNIIPLFSLRSFFLKNLWCSNNEVPKIPTEFINSADRNLLRVLGRGVVGLIGRKLGGHTIRAVAECFKQDPVPITQGVKKVGAKLREESDFKQAVEKIERTLTKKRDKKILNSLCLTPFTIFDCGGR